MRWSRFSGSRNEPNRVKLEPPKVAPDHPILVEAERQLVEYFSNKRTDFDLPPQAKRE